MKEKVFTLDKLFSTTQLVSNRMPEIENKPEDKVKTVLFLPPNSERKAEGGLRKKGYFKYSYEIENGRWYACDWRGRRLFEVEPPENFSIDFDKFKTKNGVVRLPLVTVITVVLNGEKYLEQTIKSVINQTYPNVEYIIIDGGSTDGTIDIIKKYENQIDYWVSEPDRGIYDAMNKGISLAVGELVGLLNSDDSYKKCALEKVVSHAVFKSQVDVVYGNSEVLYQDKRLFVRISGNPGDIKKHMVFYHPESFVRLKTYKSLGGYKSEYQIASDYDFFLRAYLMGCVFEKVNAVVVEFRLGGLSYSKGNLAQIEVWKIKRENGLNSVGSTLYMLSSIFKYYAKRFLGIKEDSSVIRLYRRFFRKDFFQSGTW